MEKIDIENKIPVQNIEMEQQKRASDLFGMFQTVSSAPTKTPINFFDQVQVYVNGSTYRLYWYDTVGNVWHYVTATA
jgi:uncharacterized protein YcfL